MTRTSFSLALVIFVFIKRWFVGHLPQGAVLPVQSALRLFKLALTYQRPENTPLLDIFVP
jgi:hypothetical protein